MFILPRLLSPRSSLLSMRSSSRGRVKLSRWSRSPPWTARRDAAVEGRHNEPAQRHGRRSGVTQPGVVRHRHDRQHGDDGEGKVGEEILRSSTFNLVQRCSTCKELCYYHVQPTVER